MTAKRKTVAKRKNPAAVALGRLGGAKGKKDGVKKGFANMDSEQVKEITRKGAKARWAKPS